VIVAVIIVAALLAAIVGALVGRYLALREVWAELGEALDNAAASAGRANNASSKVESISLAWPGVVERVEKLDADVLRFIPKTQEAERQAADTAARVVEMEQALAANFSIQLSGRR
jgi:hypothetical protein